MIRISLLTPGRIKVTVLYNVARARFMMIYTHDLKKPGIGVKSLLDGLKREQEV